MGQAPKISPAGPPVTRQIRDGESFKELRASLGPKATQSGAKGVREVCDELCGGLVHLKQVEFYPLVASLFSAAGIRARLTPRGDTNDRMDLVLPDAALSMPVEIKSPTETLEVDIKSVQQAIENKIVLDQRRQADFPSNPDASSLVVAFGYPSRRSGVDELIEDSHRAFGIRVGLLSLSDLFLMAVKAQVGQQFVSRCQLASLRGRLR